MTITREAIQSDFPHRLIYFADASYAAVDGDWLIGELYPAFHRFLSRNGVWKWDEQYDCDNFTRMFCAFSEIAHYKAGREVEDEGIAVGEFWYGKGGDYRKGHAIVIFYQEEGKPRFLEPQTGREIQLTDEERASCYFVRF